MWRRLTIPGQLRLDDVHDVLQQAMGWTDSHLHRFHVGEPYASPYFLTGFDVEEGEEGTLETDARLDQVLRAPGDALTYPCDFGDDWRHTVTLEDVSPLPSSAADEARDDAGAGSAAYPIVCIAGERACPPEDVGGITGCEEAAAWARQGRDPRRELNSGLTGAELENWLPAGWDPDRTARGGEEFNRLASGLRLVAIAAGRPLEAGRGRGVEDDELALITAALASVGWRVEDGCP